MIKIRSTAARLYAVLLISSLFTACKRTEYINASTNGLEVSPKSFDLGPLTEGESKSAVYEVKNPSSETITVKVIRVSCGCTSAVMDSMSILPGQTVKLHAQMTNRGVAGLIAARASLVYELAGRQLTTKDVHVQAMARQLASIDPGHVDLGKVQFQRGPRTVEIMVYRGNAPIPWTSLELGSHPPRLAAEFSQVSNDISKVILKFDPADLPLGRYSETLNFNFISASHEVLGHRSVILQAEITGPIEIKPTSLYFGVVEPGHDLQGTFEVRGTDQCSIQVKGIQEIPGNGRFVLTPQARSPDLISVHYLFHSPSVGGESSGVIRLTVGTPQKNFVMDVPVICYVQEHGKRP